MPIRRTTLAVVLVLPLAALVGGCKKPMEDFTSTEWKFKARFPGQPKEKIDSRMVGGQNVKFTMFMTEERNGGFMVGVADQVPPNGDLELVKLVGELVEKYGKY